MRNSSRLCTPLKKANKEKLAAIIFDQLGIEVSTNAIFDVQIKRLHAYKRQLLHVFGILEAYLAIKNGENRPSRVHVFGLKPRQVIAMPNQ